MRTIAILPIKSFGAAKQRLSGLLGGGSRQALAQAMFGDVLAALRRVPGVGAVAVVTANAVAESAARGGGVVLLRDHDESGHSEAAQIGIDYALEHGFERALLVPGDTPLLDPVEVGDLLDGAGADHTGLVIVPDRHGTGTNALLLCPPDAISPAFGPGSCQRHRSLAAEAGISHRIDAVPSLTLDVDTPDDLAELSGLLEDRRGSACLTRGALRQLHRSGGRPTAPAGRRGAAAPVQVRA